MWLYGLNNKKYNKIIINKCFFKMSVYRIFKEKVKELNNCNIHGDVSFRKISSLYKKNEIFDFKDNNKLNGFRLKENNFHIKNSHCQMKFKISYLNPWKTYSFKKIYLSVTAGNELNYYGEKNLDLEYNITKLDKISGINKEFKLFLNTNQGTIVESNESFSNFDFIEEKISDRCNNEVLEDIIKNKPELVGKMNNVCDSFVGTYKDYIYNASTHLNHFNPKNKCLECYNFFYGPSDKQFYQFIKEVGNVVLECKGLK